MSTYETDLYLWTLKQAALFQARDADGLDWSHLREEMESMGGNLREGMYSQLIRLMWHLLKWRYQPGKRQYGYSWQTSIDDARTQIALALEVSPSLKTYLPRNFDTHYQRARRRASRETELPLATFPEVCPWTLEQLLDEDFFPEASDADV
jgi:hypothetical protein